ncbi:MAG: response regulator transcription factor [Lachnospiraceae bacterium]|nr:response regulator transcription factor [Lachnospiraceae bacterium]
MSPKRIYAADDEKNIRDILKLFLDDAGYETQVFPTGDELLAAFCARPCDLVILDIMMPGTDGVTVCKKLREISSVPIIMLTAKETEMDYTIGLASGSDDYMVKPFKPSMLVMRIKALLRRIELDRSGSAEAAAGGAQSYGDITYSEKLHSIICRGAPVRLTGTELSVLRHLMDRQDAAVSREELLSRIWGLDASVETRVTDETVRRIRKKLRAAGSDVTIITVWGYGYRLSTAQQDETGATP